MPQIHNNRRQLPTEVYSYETERIQRLLAFILLIFSSILFAATSLGILNGLSESIQNSLLNMLGYTNKWSKTFGPSWFVHTMNDLSALAGKVILFLSSAAIIGYYKIRNEHKLLWKFLIVVFGGGLVLTGLKLLFAENIPYEPVDLLISNVAVYPSGHAMMATIFYLTVAVLLMRKQRRVVVRKYTLIVASIIIVLIGLARIFGAAHSLSEVVAGWSAGLIWLCLCWLAERYIMKNLRWNM